MRYHTQNLNESGSGDVIGSIIFHGRAWFGRFKCEWLTAHKARDFAATITFGHGDDSEDGVMIHICLPLIFSIYFSINGIFKCKECRTGVAIHNGGFWIDPLVFVMESNRNDPWYRQNFCWNFPWQLDWHSTEILSQHTRELAKSVFVERRGDGKRLGLDCFEINDLSRGAADDNSSVHDYTYVRKSGEVQKRKATIHVTRMTWRARWWPLIPRKKVSTCIDVKFNDEVGEGSGSWKGGCTGCGYEMNPNETPLECLKRMERERKFDR